MAAWSYGRSGSRITRLTASALDAWSRSTSRSTRSRVQQSGEGDAPGGDQPSIDATETSINRNTCIVWRSAKLEKLIGMAYAAGTTRSGTTTAHMRAERLPRR
jgi:hypothetical protein